jgi:hypothetical protein
VNPIQHLIEEATAHAQQVAETQRMESEAFEATHAARLEQTKAELVPDLAVPFPHLKELAAYLQMIEVDWDYEAERAVRATVCLKLPDCDLILFTTYRADTWGFKADDAMPFTVYPDVEEWHEYTHRDYPTLLLAIHGAYDRYARRMQEEACQAADVEADMRLDILLEWEHALRAFEEGGYPVPLGTSLDTHIRGLVLRLRQCEALRLLQAANASS